LLNDNPMSKSTSNLPAAEEAQAGRRALRRTLVHRLVRNGVIVAGFILVALGIGATGYHTLDGLPWLDAVLNAAMILTGMGPIAPISTPAAKVFATFYALFSGVFFLTMVAVLLAPALHHFLHRFHIDLRERESHRTDRRE
jgi:hypothetical protein